MKKTWKRSALLMGTAMLGAIALSGTNVQAGDVTMDINVEVNSTLTETATNMDFGTIDLNPAGDTVTIDATAGSATPATTGTSVITGGTSGTITVASPNAFTITVTYPATATLNGSGTAAGETLTVSDIAANSEGGSGPVTKSSGPSPGSDAVIHVGGAIVFPADTVNGPYSGTMTITLNYS